MNNQRKKAMAAEMVIYNPLASKAPSGLSPARAGWPMLPGYQQPMQLAPAMPPPVTLQSVLMGNVVSTFTGTALGVVEAVNGGQMDVKGVPVDAALGTLMSTLAVLFNSPSAASSSYACSAVYGYRKMGGLVAMLKELRGESAPPTTTVAGEESKPLDPNKDPIVAAAEAIKA